jgi:pimeloyl-ACP methyl ester carboxylesterase
MKFLFLTLLLAACSHSDKKPESSKRHITLINGLHLDETSWKDVKDKLILQNFAVTTVNRAGRDIKQQVSLKKLATIACEQTPASSILVGHSFGGAIINAMVGICPEKIKQIIYVSALVPLKGEKPFEQTSKTDQKEYGKVVTVNQGKLTPRTAKYFFSIADMIYKYEMATAPKLYPESTGLSAEPVMFEQPIFDAIPKAYIYTNRDKFVSLKTQEGYTLKTNISKTETMPTGHFPMLSNPELLTQDIIKFCL